MGANESELVGFGMTECGSDRRDAGMKLFEVGKGSQVWKRERKEEWRRPSVIDDVDGVLCAMREGALVVVAGILVGERDVVGACDKRR